CPVSPLVSVPFRTQALAIFEIKPLKRNDFTHAWASSARSPFGRVAAEKLFERLEVGQHGEALPLGAINLIRVDDHDWNRTEIFVLSHAAHEAIECWQLNIREHEVRASLPRAFDRLVCVRSVEDPIAHLMQQALHLSADVV